MNLFLKLARNLFLLTPITFLTASPFRPTQINLPLHAPDSSLVKFVDSFPNLTFSRPVFMTSAPDGTGRVFVVEQTGLIKVFPKISSATAAQTFADLKSQIYFDGGEMGLLGMAFSPDFIQSGEFFVSYTANNPKRLIVARMKVSATNINQANPQSLEKVIEISKTFANYGNHNGGMIAFGPDRKLYIGVGDGGGAGDIFTNAQNKSVLWGKILRIDPLAAKPYSVPLDNPFVGERDSKEEIFAFGMRNPWRFSFDRETGEIIAGDVGQGDWEEIDIIKKGGNYGWNVFEAQVEFNNPNNLSASSFVSPIWEYSHSQGISITGGYVYRGQNLAMLKGSYVYADYGSGRVWALQKSGNEVLSNYEIGIVDQPSSFFEDDTGELSVLSYAQGKILRLESNETTTPVQLPHLLSQTGIFTDLQTLTPVEGLQEYTVASPLWSDGAAKRRWMGFPGAGKIEFSDKGLWNYPVGSIFVKHFELNTPDNAHRKLETRLFYQHEEGWRGYTYVWNVEQTDAELIDQSQTQDFEVVNAATHEVKLQTWTFPGRQDCLRCHNFSAGYVLGANTGQLNHLQNGEIFLATMNRFNIFQRSIGDPNLYQRYADPYDTSSQLQSRFRSYVAANCAQCHNPTGAAPGHLDFRYQVSNEAMNVMGVPTSESQLSVGEYRVQAGHPENSALYNRVHSLDPKLRMPPLASSVEDIQGVQLINDWIRALERSR